MSTPELEDSIWRTIALEEERRQSLKATATQQLSDRVGQIHRNYPSLAPGVKLSLAKAGLSDEQIIEIAKKSATAYDPNAEQKKKQKSWFERNVMDKVKTASRYGFAGLEFIPQMAQGAAAQIFDDNEDVKGWFISTDLGSLIANDEQAGSGFFIGGRAKELQATRARRYRGTIDGHAFTIGRGLASVALKEDTLAYNLLSGAVDGVVALATPSVPVKGVNAAARVLQEAGSTNKVVGAIADASRLVGSGSKEIGLTKLNAEARQALVDEVGLVGDAVDLEKANRFFTTGAGRRLIQRTAETNDFDETWQLWGKKLDAETTQKLADAKTEQEVMASLLDVLGTKVTSTVGLSGTKKIYTTTRWRNEKIASIPGGKGVSRAWAKMPQKNINLFQAETPRDQATTLDTVDRALKLFKIAGQKLDKDGNVLVNDLRKDFINRAGKLLVTKNEIEINKFYKDLEEEMKNAIVNESKKSPIKKYQMSRELVDELYSSFARYKEETAVFTADALGVAEDMGLYRKINGIADEAVDDRYFSGGLTLSELGTKEFFIPDPKQIRRLTNNFNFIWVKKDPNLKKLNDLGELRFPLAAAERFQNEIWRPYITATVGNFLRNTIDSSISLYLSGKGAGYSSLRHPFEWFQMVGSPAFKNTRVGRGDLLAQDWEGAVRDGLMGESIKDYRAATGNIVEAHFQDPIKSRRAAAKLGIFKQYARRTDIIDPDFVRAHGDELGRLNAEWSMRMLAGGSLDEAGNRVGGMTVDEIIDAINRGDKQAKKWFDDTYTSYKNGKPVMNRRTGETVWESIDLKKGDNLRFLLESQAARLQKLTGNNPELLDVVGQGLLRGRQEVVDSKYIVGDLRPGSRVEVTRVRTVDGKKVKSKFLARVEGSQISAKGEQVTVTPYAFDGIGDNTDELRRLLSDEAVYKDPNMPRYAVGEIRDPNTPRELALKASFDRMISGFYGHLYTKPIAYLERSPTFRSGYYEWVDKLAISLDEKSLNKIIDDITDRVADPEKYLTPGLWKKLQDFKANPEKLYGTLDADEVSSYASAAALDEYKRIVYNAVERRNITDIMRFISPFAQQHAEFMGRLGRLAFNPVKGGELGYLPNVDTFRKVQLAIEGGKDADPDGDGRGIFFRDPTSGQLSFQFPLTGGLTKAVTGITAPITAPLRGVAMGFDYKPGLGPFASIAASKLLTDNPSFDFMRKILLPYGEQNDVVGALVPSWVKKAYDGTFGGDNGRFFANTFAETSQAIAATGKYDLSDEKQRVLMENEAREKARVFTVLRSITQFLGPAAGDVDIKTVTEQGDVYATGLAAALQSLRNMNYETANLRFIEIFGEDAFVYLSNKTTSDVGGLMGSKEFGVFERNNKGLFKEYKEIAGYFGPIGTAFDFEVYTRQLQTGARRRLSPEEMLKASQRAIGLAYYQDMKEHLGPKLGKVERQYLADYKKKIIAKYPGFGESQYDPTETPREIEKLFEAAKSDSLKDNETAQAVNYYEQIRMQVMQEANNRGFESLKSDSLVDLQDYLSSYADALIEKYPSFARVFDRLLSKEFD